MHTVRSALFALALSLVAAPAFAEGFLKVDGVEGESADEKHKLEIDIDSMTMKAKDLHIVKKADKASAKLAALAGKKAALPGSVVVVMKKPKKPKGKQVEFLKVILTEVFVSSARTTPQSPGLEALDLSAKSFDVYESGGASGPWVKVDAATLNKDYPTIFLP